MKLKTILLIIAYLCIANAVFTQVTGSVSYRDGGKIVPLSGANVYWYATQIGTVTDVSGKFIIEKPENARLLIVSYVGFTTDTIAITRKSQHIEVVLTESNLLDEVTVGERANTTTFDRLDPLVTQKINDGELKQAACCNLGESFETNASVDAAYSDAGTGAKQIKLLGLSGRYVQMMTENIPNFYGLATPYGLEYVPGPWMQSIAISKGTASVVYGYEAMTGQINTWYKEPHHKADNFYLNLLANDAGKTEINTDFTYRLGKKVSGMLLLHGGYDWTENDHNNDGFMDMPLVKRYFLFNRYNAEWKPGFESKFGVKLLYEDRSGGQLSDMLNPYVISIDTRRAEAFFKSGYTFAGEPLQSLSLISSWSYHDQKSIFGNTLYNASQQSFYVNSIFTSEIGSSEKHSMQAGLSYKFDNYTENLNEDNFDRNESVPGAFVEYSFAPTAAFKVVTGARVDYHNLYGWFFVPRMHLRYKIAPLTTLKASVGKGIRTPAVLAENAYLLASSRTMVISTDLLPEVAWNAGGNIMQQIPVGNREITLVADFYRTSFVNQVVVDLDEDINRVLFYNLEGQSYSNVAQIEIMYPFIKGMDFTAAFRYNDVKQNIGGVLREVPFTSNFKALLSASYKTPLKKWQFDFTSQFNGGGRIPSTLENPEFYQRETRFEPYVILNAQITKYFRKWELYAGVENITNFVQHNPVIASEDPWGEYFDAAMVWGPLHGRKFYLGIRYAINRNV